METTNKILTEVSLSYPEQLEKMRKLNDGTRDFNVAASLKGGTEKIRYNYKICVGEGFTRAKKYIEDALKALGRLDVIEDLMITPLPKLSARDMHYADFACVKSHCADDTISALLTVSIYYTFLYLIYAIILKCSKAVDKLKEVLINKYHVKLEDLKKAIKDLMSDSEVTKTLVDIVNFKEKKEEGLEEDTKKVKDGKWVNKGKEGTHGTFKTKKAADAQRKAMFANGYHENLTEEDLNKLAELLKDPKYKDVADYVKNNKQDLEEKVEKHETLNPKLFDEANNLKPEVREKILAIAKEFTDSLAEDNIKINIKDIVIVGSNCSYNYNENSDLDIHIKADTKSLECPDNLYPLLYSAYRSIFNKTFDIDFYGIPVEIFVETVDEGTDETTGEHALVSNGIYSVLNDTWVKEPVATEIPEINQDDIDKAMQPWIERYMDLTANDSEISATDKIANIEKYIEDIYELRKSAIATDGEYSVGNLIFKELRGKGYLDELKNLKNELKSKEFSLESLQENLAEQTRRKYVETLSRISHNQVILNEYGKFNIYLVKESDVDTIISRIRQLDFVANVSKIPGKFDFSKPMFTGIQPRYWTISGNVKENEDI